MEIEAILYFYGMDFGAVFMIFKYDESFNLRLDCRRDFPLLPSTHIFCSIFEIKKWNFIARTFTRREFFLNRLAFSRFFMKDFFYFYDSAIFSVDFPILELKKSSIKCINSTFCHIFFDHKATHTFGWRFKMFIEGLLAPSGTVWWQKFKTRRH